MTPTQEYIVNKMRSAQQKQGCVLSDITMFRPFGHHEKVPTWTCDYPNGKQIIHSINKAGYNIYQRVV